MTDTLLIALLLLQIAMGAFDTLYHHEMTERLAWHAQSGRELRLHSVRNAFYCLLFLLVAWAEPHGALALLVLVVLAIELVVTLADFVEEDLSRRLPGTERVAHTLLAVNYGAILAIIGPMLWAWSSLPTDLVAVNRGLLSAASTLAAIAVAVFSVRDWLAAGRSARLAPTPAGHLMQALGPRRTVLVTGASGFVGSRLVAALAEAGHDVIAQVRSPERAAGLATPVTIVTRLDQIPASARIDAIVNLAGSPVADWPWTLRNRLRILRSRLTMARDIERLVARLATPPSVLVGASAIGFYGEGGDDQLTEADRPSGTRTKGFAHRSCAAVEQAARRMKTHGVRVVALRIGLVLDHTGGMLARMLPAFDLGLGGRIGGGRQWMSWIARDDVVRLIAHAIATPDIDGALNATAPAPVRNGEFTSALARALGRPAIAFIPAAPLRVALGDMGREILLASQRVLPAKALGTGFVFRYPTLESAIAAAVGLEEASSSGGAATQRPHPGRSAALARAAE